MLRQTDFQNPDFVRETANTPINLDRSAESIRPFGLAHENRKTVQKVNAAGETFDAEKHGLGKGFPANLCRQGPVAVSCGHIMHYSCFETYIDATSRRHVHQIARHHPESLERKEFVCPLCKALGNAFLPITWDGKEESYPGILSTPGDLASFLDTPVFVNPRDFSQAGQLAFTDYVRVKMPETYNDISSQPGGSDASWDAVAPQSVGIGTPFSDSFSAVATPDSSVRSRSPETPHDKVLKRAYDRLRETLKSNKLLNRFDPDAKDEDLGGNRALSQSVGFSISATEITQRGVEALYGMTLIEKIPEQTLIQLRILSETVSSYISIGGLRYNGENKINSEFQRDAERQFCQIFVADYFGREMSKGRSIVDTFPPILSQDPFILLCESVFGIGMARYMDINNLVRIFYLAEIVKTVYHIARNMPIGKWLEHMMNRNPEDKALANFATFCNNVTLAGIKYTEEVSELPTDLANLGFEQTCMNSLEDFYAFVKKYALVFLRKSTILLHVHYGVDFNSFVPAAPEEDELSRLTAALRIPSFDEMCAALTPYATNCGWPSRIEAVVHGWLRHQVYFPLPAPPAKREGPHVLPSSAQLSHPGIFELVGLPKNFDTLIEQCAQRRCPSTGKDLADPIVCLFCGDIFCGQTICCLMDYKEDGREDKPTMKIGGASQHMMFK